VNLFAGLGGAARHACVALCTERDVLGVCEQERITRVRGAGFNSTGLPDEVLDTLLARSGLQRHQVTAYGVAEPVATLHKRPGIDLVRLDRHFALACSAFLPSPFESATIVICDRESPEMSIWTGAGATITRVDCPWEGPGLAAVYSGCAEALGFRADGSEQRMEAMARLEPARRDVRAEESVSFGANSLRLAPDWQARIESWEGTASVPERRSLAAALQSRIGDLLLEFLARVQCTTAVRSLCLGGSLFANSYFNSLVKNDGRFDGVFVPVNPADAGLSVGAALHVSGAKRRAVSPFLGPSFSAEEIKQTLDNCKLTYQWLSEADRIDFAVRALKESRLVAWFEGGMEWGPRALGARSIVANPFARYVLDNLNRFLKRREMWRGYALSGVESAVHAYFDGPQASPFMECDYVPKDRVRFREILPEPQASVRVQTVGPSDGPGGFRGLLAAFGQASGIPILVNTSFNGIREPIVCTPNDAVRLFFGSGLDVLVLGDFVITK
jgi:carbamoyltransferase